MLQRCADCGRVRHYPRPLCDACHSFAVDWVEAPARPRCIAGRWRTTPTTRPSAASCPIRWLTADLRRGRADGRAAARHRCIAVAGRITGAGGVREGNRHFDPAGVRGGLTRTQSVNANHVSQGLANRAVQHQVRNVVQTGWLQVKDHEANPFRFASSGKPAAGYTTRDDPIVMNRSASSVCRSANCISRTGIDSAEGDRRGLHPSRRIAQRGKRSGPARNQRAMASIS